MSYVNHVKVCLIGLQNPPVFQYSDFSSVKSVYLEEKCNICLKGKKKKNILNSVKEKGNIQMVDKATGNLTTFQKQDQSEKLLSKAFRKMCKPP